jgi:hypothetical protein
MKRGGGKGGPALGCPVFYKLSYIYKFQVFEKESLDVVNEYRESVQNLGVKFLVFFAT